MANTVPITSLNRMLGQDNEIGTTNKPPRLQSTDDYHNWVFRFKSFLLYQDSGLWRSIENGPHVPMNGAARVAPADYTEADNKQIGRDGRCFAALTMALPTELSHGFQSCENAKELWLALQKRFEGNADMQASRKNLLLQQFNDFRHVNGESLESLINRYIRLINTMKLANVVVDDEEVN